MPDTKRTAHGRSPLSDPQPAALAALSVAESLILALVESGCLSRSAVRRCLLDAAAAHERAAQASAEDPVFQAALHSETIRLIDRLLLQVEAAAPGAADVAPGDAGTGTISSPHG